VVTAEPQAGRMHKFQAAGSGVIISHEGHVITNHHVAGKARRIVCRLADGDEVSASLVGTDPLADIAVVKLDLAGRSDPSRPVPVARFGDSDALRVGDPVLAMGSPAALSQSVTRGIVSNTRLTFPEFYWPFTLRLDGEEVGTLVRWIGHDAPITGGNSGGPLVNMRGGIVGINEIALGLSGAIPGNLARDVAEQLIADGHVRRSWTGLEVQPLMKDADPRSGVLVAGVIADSPADRAGLRPGDVITRFGGVAVRCRMPEELPGFNRLVLGWPVGQIVRIEAVRAGETKQFKLTTVDRGSARGRDVELTSWGVTARDLTRLSALERNRPSTRGVLVYSVRPGGPCGEAKPPLANGDVIVAADGNKIDGVADLRALARRGDPDGGERTRVVVGFDRKERHYLTVVELGPERDDENPALVRKPWLGLATQVFTEELARAMDMEGVQGVRVTQVIPGSSAAEAGVKVGDIILRLDGEAVEASRPGHARVFKTMLRRRRVGSDADLDVRRGDESLRFKVRLESPPTPPERAGRLKDRDYEFSARNLVLADRTDRKLPDDLRGVLVTRVEPAGWAALARLAIGDVLLRVADEPVPDVDSLRKALARARTEGAKRVPFFVRRGVHTMFLELEPDWKKGDR
jgi:serine protease Do